MIAPARAAAFWALQHIASGDTTLGDALARARLRVEDDRDKALVNEIVTGTLRHRAALDYQLSTRATRGYASFDADVLTALRLSAFQLLYLTRVPASAVVNDAVNLVRAAGKTSAGSLVNAVLRRLTRERRRLAWPARPSEHELPAEQAQLVEHLATVFSHPAWLVARWLQRYGVPATERWLAFDNEVPALTIAANTARQSRADLMATLATQGVTAGPTAVAGRGLVMSSPGALASQAFRDGLFLVQDEASQLVAEVVPGRAGDRILDACAAPGGKTVALSEMVGGTGLVVATDIRARRVRTLRETLARCAAENVRVVHVAADGALPFADAAFDRILVDAPCSGLGTLRRDPDIRWRRAPEDLRRFAEAQLLILQRVAPLVAPGGDLVYSTCSSEPEENQAIVEAFLATHQTFSLRAPDLTGRAAAWRALVTEQGYLRTLPFRDGLEAFFAAILHRDEATGGAEPATATPLGV